MQSNLSPEERDQYTKARTTIDDTVKSHGPLINEQIQILGLLRAKKEYYAIDGWLKSLANTGIDAEGFLKVEDIHKRLTKGYLTYFRIAFNFRFALRMVHNINFRKIISFEYFALHSQNVFEVNERFAKPSTERLKADQKLFFLSPQAHFFVWRILAEVTVRLDGNDMTKVKLVSKLYNRMYSAMAFFAQDTSVLDPDSLRTFLQKDINKDILRMIDSVDGKISD